MPHRPPHRRALVLALILGIGAVVLPSLHRAVGHGPDMPVAAGEAVGGIDATCALCATTFWAIGPVAPTVAVAVRMTPWTPAVAEPPGRPGTPSAIGRAPPLV